MLGRVCGALLVAFLVSAQAASLKGVYYQVIGTGNFDVYTVDINVHSGEVTKEGQLGNAYGSYTTQCELDTVQNLLYWPYPTPYENTAMTLSSGDIWYYDNLTVGLHVLGADKVLALTSNDTTKQVFMSMLHPTERTTASTRIERIGASAVHREAGVVIIATGSTFDFVHIESGQNTSLARDFAGEVQSLFYDAGDNTLLVVNRINGSFSAALEVRHVAFSSHGAVSRVLLTVLDSEQQEVTGSAKQQNQLVLMLSTHMVVIDTAHATQLKVKVSNADPSAFACLTFGTSY